MILARGRIAHADEAEPFTVLVPDAAVDAALEGNLDDHIDRLALKPLEYFSTFFFVCCSCCST